MNKKTLISWGFVCVLLSACVYLSIPKTQKTADQAEDKTLTAEQLAEEIDMEAIVEAYFSSRPVRDVPESADFSSFLVGSFAKSQRNFEKTADAYAAVLKNDPENQEVKDALYQHYVLAGYPEKAFPYAQIALENKPE